MRAAIKRYTEEKRSLDILNNESFARANKVFSVVLKDNKVKGKGKIHHKEIIRSEDLEKLQDYFSRYMKPSAVILQQMVQFNLMFYLCRRGHENLTGMPKDTFEVK